MGRAPRGARGLKSFVGQWYMGSDGRAPRGARGLKFKYRLRAGFKDDVAPHEGRVD